MQPLLLGELLDGTRLFVVGNWEDPFANCSGFAMAKKGKRNAKGKMVKPIVNPKIMETVDRWEADFTARFDQQMAEFNVEAFREELYKKFDEQLRKNFHPDFLNMPVREFLESAAWELPKAADEEDRPTLTPKISSSNSVLNEAVVFTDSLMCKMIEEGVKEMSASLQTSPIAKAIKEEEEEEQLANDASQSTPIAQTIVSWGTYTTLVRQPRSKYCNASIAVAPRLEHTPKYKMHIPPFITPKMQPGADLVVARALGQNEVAFSVAGTPVVNVKRDDPGDDAASLAKLMAMDESQLTPGTREAVQHVKTVLHRMDVKEDADGTGSSHGNGR